VCLGSVKEVRGVFIPFFRFLKLISKQLVSASVHVVNIEIEDVLVSEQLRLLLVFEVRSSRQSIDNLLQMVVNREETAELKARFRAFGLALGPVLGSHTLLFSLGGWVGVERRERVRCCLTQFLHVLAQKQIIRGADPLDLFVCLLPGHVSEVI